MVRQCTAGRFSRWSRAGGVNATWESKTSASSRQDLDSCKPKYEAATGPYQNVWMVWSWYDLVLVLLFALSPSTDRTLSCTLLHKRLPNTIEPYAFDHLASGPCFVLILENSSVLYMPRTIVSKHTKMFIASVHYRAQTSICLEIRLCLLELGAACCDEWGVSKRWWWCSSILKSPPASLNRSAELARKDFWCHELFQIPVMGCQCKSSSNAWSWITYLQQSRS